MSQDVATLVSETDIAIVGLAGRFPGARTPDALWTNIRAGVESVRRLTDAELRAAGVPEETLQDPHYVKAAAPLEDMDRFDSAFFGFSPKEADILDPQHRHFLECAWEALEHAGHPPERFAGSIGVFGGCGMNAYFMFNLLTNPALVKSVGLFLLRHTGNDKDFLTTRVSYLLNLTGPSVGIQTACSTSLVAIHTACQHLLNRECDLALAGGVTIELPHGVGYQYEPGEILSPDGHCRAFDAASQGTVFGSGVGIVCLRRLEDALADGDTIHAVIKGSAVNNDGATKVGYLAPSVDGQAASIIEALSIAGVEADTISYVETHGTGTPVGDPIEIAALTQAFRTQTMRSGYCAIGSLKTNIGHLDTAAGVASVIKVVQALKHRELPPSLHFTQPNPSIDFAATPFRVNSALRPWQPEAGTPRRAGVSSLGVGGTNAHVILEEAPARPASSPARPFNLFLLSAKTATALDGQAARLAAALQNDARSDETSAGGTNAGAGAIDAIDAINLTDAAYTLAIGRRAFDRRRAVVAQDRADAVRQLAASDPTRVMAGEKGRVAPAVVMLFPGGGAQHPGMARDLYRDEPVFRAELDRALAICARLGHPDLSALVHLPTAGASALSAASASGAAAEAEAQAQADAIDRASRELAKPAKSILSVFAIEYALARLWMSWGVQPSAMIGHSLGEYVAACLAGVMTLEEALALVAKRGELFERLPAGAMLSVTLSEAALRTALASGTYGGVRLDNGGADALSIAAANAPDLTVVSGRVEAIARLESALTAQGVEARRLHIDVAAHSPMLDPLLEEFSRFVRTMPLRPATLRFISNLTGTWADPREVATADYWTRHLRGTVRFTDGLQTVLREPNVLLLEVGPGQTLTSLARQHRVDGAAPVAAASLRHARETHSDLLPLHQALGRLWAQGVEVDWRTFYARDRRRRVPLPTYAFDHRRHWIAPGQGQFTGAAGAAAPAAHAGGTAGDAGGVQLAVDGGAIGAGTATEIPTLERLTDVVDWAYRPVWVPAPTRADAAAAAAGAEAAGVTTATATAAGAAATAVAPQNWLIFGDAEGTANADGTGETRGVETLSALVARGLMTAGHRVTRVVAGSAFARQDDATWRMRPDAREDAGRLVADLLAAGRLPRGVAHLWLAETDGASAAASSTATAAAAAIATAAEVPAAATMSTPSPDAQARHDLARGFYSLLHLAQAIGEHDPEYGLDLTIVTRGAELVAAAGDARSERPARAAAYGAVRVLPRELTGFTARTIDLQADQPRAHASDADDRRATAHALAAELLSQERVSPLALRSATATHGDAHADLTRWTLTHQPVPLTDGTASTNDATSSNAAGTGASAQRTEIRAGLRTGLRDRGVYLITGGFTGIGFELARHIAATTAGATLALVGRTVLPSPPSSPSLDAASGVAASGPAATIPGVARDAALTAAPASDASIADRLAAIDTLERAGATVLPYAADVTDAAAMTRVIADLRARAGALHGVLHAAGVIDDALVSMKTAAAAARVLAPKVDGAMAIDRALTGSGAAADLDLFVLFSSTSALLGLPGQIDYAAANAFLDAFARERQTRAPGRTLAIDWGVWSEAGMAARGRTWNASDADARLAADRHTADASAGAAAAPAAAAATETAATALEPTGHPLLGDRIRRSADLAIFEARYSPDALWVLDEHRLQGGLALLPGTGFVEMARAAWHDLTGARDVQIDELEFLSPLEVADGATRVVRITLERLPSNDSPVSDAPTGFEAPAAPAATVAAIAAATTEAAKGTATAAAASDAASWAFTVESAPADAAHDDAAFDEHARATLMRPATPLHASRRRDPDAASPQRGDRIAPGSPADVWQRQGRHMRFGPRWRTIAELHVDAIGAAASAAMALPAGFESDLAIWQAHPALLDFATASGLAAVPGYAACPDLFVPIAYRRIVIGPLPAAFSSHARPAAGARASDADVTLDVELIAPDGTPLATIDGFAMRRLSPERLAHPRASAAVAAADTGAPAIAAATAAALSAAAAPGDAAVAASAARAGASASPRPPLAELLAHGIRTADGVTAFTRALSVDAGPELIISSIALPRLRAFVDAAFGRRAASAQTHDANDASAAQDDLDPTERIVADIWRELLGLRNVGPDDDFLMSGGHSLLAVRLAARLEKRFKTRVRLSAIFDAPTVRRQAALVRPAAQAAVRASGAGISLMNQTTETAAAPDAVSAAEAARTEAPPLIAVSRDAFRRKRSSLPGHDRS